MKKGRIFALFMVFMLVFSIGIPTFSVPEEIVINEWHTAVSPNYVFSTSEYGTMYADMYYASYGPYMKVYEVKLQKGSSYTLYMKHPTNQGYMNMVLTGINPSANDYSYVNGTSSDFIMFFQQPWEDAEGRAEGYRKNFTISDTSETSNFYIVCNFEKPNVSFEFMIKSPPDSDDDVENSTTNFISPHRNGYTWGGLAWYPIHSELPNGLTVVNPPSNVYDDSTSDDSYYEEEYYEEEYYEDDYIEDNTYADVVPTVISEMDVSALNLGQVYSLVTAGDVDTTKIRPILVDPYSSAYQIYSFPVTPGQKYTFDFMYRSYNQVNAYILGATPFGSTNYGFESGTNTVMAAFQEQPYHDLTGTDFYGSRTQFTVSSDSTSTKLYVLVRAYSPDENFKMVLKSGYTSQEDESYNPYDTSRIGYKWVNQWDLPLKVK